MKWRHLFLIMLAGLWLTACGAGNGPTEGQTAVTEPPPDDTQPEASAESVAATTAAPAEETAVAAPDPAQDAQPVGPNITADLEITESQRVEAEGERLDETAGCFERLFGSGRFVLFDDGSLTYTPADGAALGDCLLLDATALSGDYEAADEADYAYEIDDIDQFAGLEDVEIDVDGTITERADGTVGTVRFRVFPAAGADRTRIQMIQSSYGFDGATAVAADGGSGETDMQATAVAPTAAAAEPVVESGLPPVNPADYTNQFSITGSSNMVIVDELMVRFGDAGYAGLPLLNLSNGTAAGIASLCNGLADGALAARTMTAEEAALCTDGGAQVLDFVLGRNPIVVMVHPENDWATALSANELATALTTAATWADVNSSWPAVPIERLFPAVDSFPYAQVSRYLFADDGDVLAGVPDARFSEDDDVLLSSVADAQGAISFMAYSGFAGAQEVTAVAIDGLAPGSEGYLFDQPIILLTLDRVLQANPDMAAFVHFALTHGRLALFDLGLALPDEPTQQANEQAWLDAVGE